MSILEKMFENVAKFFSQVGDILRKHEQVFLQRQQARDCLFSKVKIRKLQHEIQAKAEINLLLGLAVVQHNGNFNSLGLL